MKTVVFLMVTLGIFGVSLTNAAAQQNFVANLSSAQEVVPNTSTGRGVAQIKLRELPTGGGTIVVKVEYSGLAGSVVLAHLHCCAPVGVTAPVAFTLNYMGGASGTISARTFTLTAQQVADVKAQRFYINLYSINYQQNGEIRGQIKHASMFTDEDGDGRDDYTDYRASDNTFYSLLSLGNRVQTRTFGPDDEGFLNGSFIGDFDGDGRADPVRFRADQTSGDLIWIIYQTATDTVRTVQWGNLFASGDFVAVGDYDGDGKQDIAVFRPNGIWYIIQSSTNTPRYEYWGQADDVAVPGDYDKDGKTDLAVTRNINGQKVWFIKQSSNNQMRVEYWGLASDSEFGFGPSQIDFDGDGAADLVVERNENNQAVFYIKRSSDNSLQVLQWGLPTDQLFVGIDQDGDGKSDIQALRIVGEQLVWLTRLSSTGELRSVVWGLASDL